MYWFYQYMYWFLDLRTDLLIFQQSVLIFMIFQQSVLIFSEIDDFSHF